MQSIYRSSTRVILGILFVILSQLSFAQNQTISYNDSWSEQGVRIISEDNQYLKLNVSLNQFHLSEKMIEREAMKTVKLKDVILQGDEGAPDLPIYSQYIAIPQGASVKVNVLKKRTETLNNVSIAPAPRIPLDTDLGPLHYEKNNAIYSKNSNYPSAITVVSKPMKIRGVDVVLLGISPFQYNPVSKELLVHRDIEIEVVFEGGNGQFGEDRLRNKWWDPIIKDMVLNDKSISDKNYNKSNLRSETGCEYLIITPDDPTYLGWADSIRNFRVRQGITTNIVTTTEIGGNSTSAIETYINDAYNNWTTPPVAVLLMADYGTSGNTITSPIYNSYCISDNIYADVDNDHMPDIIFARMTAQNADHLETMVMKVLDYERTPPTNPGFYSNPITAMGWQTERWFQLCSEIIAGFFENSLGKTPVRENAIYSGSPSGGIWSTATNTATIINVFGEEGLGYIPDSPSYLSDWGGNASRINTDINNGAFLLQHRDHGSTTGWGEPAYSSADINGLNNEDLCFIFSINCLTGKFDESGECFAEKFHRHEYGALGIIAATEVSYSFVNDTYVWGLYDNLWPDFMPQFETEPESRDVLPAFGNAAGKYFLEQSGWPYNTSNKEVTYNLFHHHGDAFSTVYYEVPQYLTVDYDDVLLSGMDYFNITVNDGAIVCLTIDGEILATAEGTGGEIEISIPAQEPGIIIDIVITKQNYYRYENQIGVIPPNGPYCMYDEHTLNDTCGNANNKPDFDEDILVSLSMKNLGSEDANNVDVTLSTTDGFIEFIDPVENFDTIHSGMNVSRDLAYKFHISDGVPDQHNVQFNITARDDNDSTWTSKFYMVARAPKIDPRELIIDDSEFGNDNGRLDPGEKAVIKVKTANIGHCSVNNVVCTLVAYNQFINVEDEEQVIPILGLFGAAYPKFTVTVADNAPIAVIAQMNFNASAAGYSVSKIYFPKIGEFLEDWETGNFDKYDWSSGGNLPWGITTQYPYEGFFHAQSGNIGNSQTSSFSISYKVMSNDDIKFHKKVSSELDKDKLSFYIDGQQRGSWSGTSQGWTEESFPITSGNHTFEWVYSKDYGGESGSDCAWVDYIELPTELVTTVFAGPNTEICAENTYQCFGIVTNHESVEWSTSGDGSFSNTTILTPVYTPGENDIENREVFLTLENFDADGETLSDEMTLALINVPNAPETPQGPDYIDVYKELETTYSIVPVELAENYNWELLPEGAGEVMVDDTSATIYWNVEFLGEATLKASAVGECGEGEYSEELLIFVDNTVGFNMPDGTIKFIVSPNPNRGNFKLHIKSFEDSPVNISLVNYLGLEVYAKENISANNGFTENINTLNLSQGVYILVVEQAGKRHTKKVVVSK